MPIAANIATLIPTVPLTALAARISGGSLTWYLLDINTGANVEIGSYTTPAGLSATELRTESIHVSEGGTPLVVARTAVDDVVAMTPTTAVAVAGFPESMDDYPNSRAMRLFESGGKVYQFFYGEDGGASSREEFWQVDSGGRAGAAVSGGSLAVTNGFTSRYLHGYHQAGYASVALYVDADEFYANGGLVTGAGFDDGFCPSLSVDRSQYTSYSSADASMVFYDVTDAPIDEFSDTVVQKDGITTADGTPTAVWAWLCDRYPDTWDESPPTIGGGGLGGS